MYLKISYIFLHYTLNEKKYVSVSINNNTHMQTMYNRNWSDSSSYWSHSFIKCIFSFISTDYSPRGTIVDHFFVRLFRTRCCLIKYILYTIHILTVMHTLILNCHLKITYSHKTLMQILFPVFMALIFYLIHS